MVTSSIIFSNFLYTSLMGIADSSVNKWVEALVILSIGNRLTLCRASHIPSIAQASLSTDVKTIDIGAVFIDGRTEQEISLKNYRWYIGKFFGRLFTINNWALPRWISIGPINFAHHCPHVLLVKLPSCDDRAAQWDCMAVSDYHIYEGVFLWQTL